MTLVKQIVNAEAMKRGNVEIEKCHSALVGETIELRNCFVSEFPDFPTSPLSNFVTGRYNNDNRIRFM